MAMTKRTYTGATTSGRSRVISFAHASWSFLCSPRARASEFVSDEIRRFAAERGAEHIIPVLVEGIPNNGAPAGQEARMAFPEALMAVMKPRWRKYSGLGSTATGVKRVAPHIAENERKARLRRTDLPL
jgi:hypothetical protein